MHIEQAAARPSSAPGILAVGVLALAVSMQALHDVEHAAQMVQHFGQGLPAAQSHGILFFADLEWNHVIFNGLYLLLLLVTTSLAVLGGRQRGWAAQALVAGTVVQSFHFLEHVVRMAQYYQVGCTPCPGTLARGGLLLGAAGFDGVLLHFMFNTTVTVLPGIYLWSRRHQVKAGCCSFLDLLLRRPHVHRMD